MISIITPVFNGREYIEQCLHSVLSQHREDLEHIVIDGGSSDGTVAVIENYASRHRHIRWISEPDDGQSQAMNKGIRMAKGDIVSFHDVDDYYEPNVLNRVRAHFDRFDKIGFLVGNCNIWTGENILKRVNRPSSLRLANLLMREAEFPYNPTAYFFRASVFEVVGYYDETEHYMFDIDMVIRVLQIVPARYFDELWGNHRHFPGTKTYELVKSGKHSEHINRLLNTHIEMLHGPVRWEVELRKAIRGRLPRLYHYLNSPGKFPAAIRRKLIASNRQQPSYSHTDLPA